MRPLSKAEIIARLREGPFLLLGEGVSPSPLYEVLETPLGPAVFPTKKGIAKLSRKWKGIGQESLLRKLFLRALKAYASTRGLPFRAEGESAAIIGPPDRAILVVLALSPRRVPSYPGQVVVVSPTPRKGSWVPLAPGCLEDLFQVLDTHLLS